MEQERGEAYERRIAKRDKTYRTYLAAKLSDPYIRFQACEFLGVPYEQSVSVDALSGPSLEQLYEYIFNLK